jgi:hypothetical protein
MNLAAIPVATIIVIVIATAGAIVVVAHPGTLSFVNYVKYVGVAAGLLGIGRGLDSTHKP